MSPWPDAGALQLRLSVAVIALGGLKVACQCRSGNAAARHSLSRSLRAGIEDPRAGGRRSAQRPPSPDGTGPSPGSAGGIPIDFSRSIEQASSGPCQGHQRSARANVAQPRLRGSAAVFVVPQPRSIAHGEFEMYFDL